VREGEYIQRGVIDEAREKAQALVLMRTRARECNEVRAK
jgi:hypothetical protein